MKALPVLSLALAILSPLRAASSNVNGDDGELDPVYPETYQIRSSTDLIDWSTIERIDIVPGSGSTVMLWTTPCDIAEPHAGKSSPSWSRRPAIAYRSVEEQAAGPHSWCRTRVPRHACRS